MKNLLVTGSIAFDRISVFKDRFANHILPKKTHMINVSFTVDDLAVHLGGTGGNIAYNLAQLGDTPYLAGTVGADFGDYRNWLERNGVKLNYVKTIDGLLTAQASIMTDLDDNQITAFYGGAMFRAHEATIDDLKDIAMAIVSPNGKEGMLYYADHFRRHDIPFIADPGQAIPAFSGEELMTLIHGAHVLIVNDYEWQLIQEKTDLNCGNSGQYVDHLIVTYGEKGSKIRSRENDGIEVPTVQATEVVDPTGCGDAYRAGLMWGLKQQYPIEKAAHVGAWIAAQAVTKAGTQNHSIKKGEFEEFLEKLDVA